MEHRRVYRVRRAGATARARQSRLFRPQSRSGQALDCVDGARGWGDERLHAFRSPGTDTDCSNNQPVYVLRNARREAPDQAGEL